MDASRGSAASVGSAKGHGDDYGKMFGNFLYDGDMAKSISESQKDKR